MTRSVKLFLVTLSLLVIASASVLAYLVVDGLKPIEHSEALPERRELPAIPTVGLPGAVEPEDELLDIAPQTAQEINSKRPFVTGRIVPAAPFHSTLTGDDRERAIDCLATAGLYEGGGRSGDQSAVMQVVLNRVRHPAFPDTICGVVFQGSERRTGCQFSFTCDGSIQRWQPSANQWQSARGLAMAMLDNLIDERVGLATHFHTDWVVPYWSDSLDKLASVRTHLFFRWRGYWGTQAAFRRRPSTQEGAIAVLAPLFAAHRMNASTEEDLAEAIGEQPETVASLPLVGSAPALSAARPVASPIRRLALRNDAAAGRWALDAVTLCKDQAVCRVVGWSDPTNGPAVLTRAALLASPPDLVFVQVARDRKQQAYWDCAKWSPAANSLCLGSAADIVNMLGDESFSSG